MTQEKETQKNEAEERKKEYIEAWNVHINDFSILAFCENEIDHKAVKSAQDILRTAVKNIAETKEFKED